MTKEDVLKQCTIDANIVKLPSIQLDRKLYQEVAKALELIGSKWKGGKIAGFVFNEDPTDLLAAISSGEQRNLKKEFQFFATPASLCDELVRLALSCTSFDETASILEPSAGQGAIIQAVNRMYENKVVDCFELMPLNQVFLKRLPTANVIGDDFLTCTNTYDVIIANPPFAKNQDIEHIQKMYECLNHNGRIVTISSVHWLHSSRKKETAFREWLDSVDAVVEEIQAGTFKESGTMVASAIIVIDK